MPDYTIYDLLTGEISYNLSTPISDVELPRVGDGKGIIAGTYMVEHFTVQDGIPTPRTFTHTKAAIDKTQITALTEFVTISELDPGTLVKIQGAGDCLYYTVFDGELTFNADLPGPYKVTCSLFPYQETTFDVEVVE